MKYFMEQLYQILSSKKLAIVLFASICLFSLPGTFMEERDIFSTVIIRVLLSLTAVNLLACTLKSFRSLSKPVIVLHIGSLLILAGCLISSFGFVATVNISEGTSTDKVYRWDLKEDVPLGMNLYVKKVNREYYPIPVKVGVLKGKEKFGLFELKTGERFNLEGFSVRADSMEFPEEVLKLSVFESGRLIGTTDTMENKGLPPEFPYKFVLVAFKDPFVKRIWVDLKLDKSPGAPVEGIAEVNNPFVWDGLRFYHTKLDTDKYGYPMAGIQIVKDPGRPFVYGGFFVMGLGVFAYLARKIYGRDVRTSPKSF